LSEADAIIGIKPVKITDLLPNKTYIMYSRVHTGSDTIISYLKSLLERKITLVDYEKIRDEKDQMLIGSSKLAGMIGIFDMFRILGEFLLLSKNLNVGPFLSTGGSAYMHPNLKSCE
jgi:hypothetical protein